MEIEKPLPKSLAVPRLKFLRLASWDQTSVFRRFMLFSGIAALLNLALIAASVTYFTFRVEQTSWEQRQREAALSGGAVVSTFIQRSLDTLTFVGALPTDILGNQGGAVIADILQDNPGLLEIIRLDAHGKVLASAWNDRPVLSSIFTIPQSNWFLRAQQGEFYLGDLQLSAQNEPYMLLAVPDSAGGVVAGRLRLLLLWEVVSKIRFARLGSAYVVDGNQRIIAHSNPYLVMNNETIPGRSPLSQIYLGAAAGYYGRYTNLEGRTVWGAAAPVERTDWVIITELPESEALASSRLAVFWLGGGTLLFFIFTTLLQASLFRRSIFNPLKKLQVGAERIGAGDLTHQVELHLPDEIGQVTQAFNRMVVQLKAQQLENDRLYQQAQHEISERKTTEAALRQARDLLDLRVQQRTTELTAVNQSLQSEIAERKRAEKFLRHRLDIEQLVASLSNTFINNPANELDQEVDNALSALGHFTGTDRCAIMLTHPDGSAFTISHEWTALGIASQKERIPVVPVTAFPWLAERLYRFETVCLNGLDNLPPDAHQERAYLESQRIRSLIAVPMVHNQALIGALSLTSIRSEPAYSEEDLALFGMVGEMIVNAVTRQQAQDEIIQRTRQAEVLLREIHHRVKNNLQIISSMLSLQMSQVQDAEGKELLRDSQNRVRSMALIHEKLYSSTNLASINLGDYTRSLTSYLMSTYSAFSSGVSFKLETESIDLGIDEAVPCGLILNELITNALKHAFPAGNTGNLVVRVRRLPDQRVELVVEDDGVGIPAHLDPRKTTTLGMQLVYALADQLHGNLLLSTHTGTQFKLSFMPS